MKDSCKKDRTHDRSRSRRTRRSRFLTDEEVRILLSDLYEGGEIGKGVPRYGMAS